MSKTNINKFSCAILDLDGTLLDSTDLWHSIDLEFLGRRGIEPPADYLEDIKTFNFENGAKYTVKRFGLKEDYRDLMKEWFDMAVHAYANTIELKPHVKEFLEYLEKSGLTICAATSSDESLYDACLKRNGIYHYFKNFTMTKEVEQDKGEPDVYLLAAEKNRAKVSDCIVFEDIISAAKGAKKGGFYTVGVFDKGSKDTIGRLKEVCDDYIHDFEELIR